MLTQTHLMYPRWLFLTTRIHNVSHSLCLNEGCDSPGSRDGGHVTGGVAREGVAAMQPYQLEL